MKRSETIHGVSEICLESWREFFALIPDFARGPAFVYRGQTLYEWPLISGIDRLQKRYPKRKNLRPGGRDFQCPPLSEDGQLKAFKNAIRGRRGPSPADLPTDDLWALGQHHGLATPLLDWTRSPFVALFFAFEEESCFTDGQNWGRPENRGVYMLSTSGIDEPPKGENDPMYVLTSECDTNYRLVSQSGVLIRIPRQTDVETYTAKRLQNSSLQAAFIKVKIPNIDRDDCLVALNKMNVNHMTLFPDIDGAAKHVNSLWQPGHDDLSIYI